MICVVSHDAGGAEILSSYIRQKNYDCLYVLAGPALKIFQRKIKPITLSTLPDAIQHSEWLLCGTSWQSKLELQAIGMAKKLGKKAIAFLDHWVNYPERFIRDNIQYLPDEIWIGDKDSKELALKHFPNTPIQLIPNPYFIDMKSEITQLEIRKKPKYKKGQRVLFICENISEHALLEYGDERYWGYNEFDAIEYFFQKIDALGVPIEKVVIRPHPSDVVGKYKKVIVKYDKIAEISDGKSLAEEIVNADIVVGCDSMAMAIALQCNRRVISCIPKKRASLSLPFKNIQMLSDLIS